MPKLSQFRSKEGVLFLAFLVFLSMACNVPPGVATPILPIPSSTAVSNIPLGQPETVTPVPTLSVPTSSPPSPSPSPSPVPPSPAPPTVAPTVTPSTLAFSESQAFSHVQALGQNIGSRPAGSEKEKAAADYIATQLQSYGYQVERQNFPFARFTDGGSRLNILQPITEELHPNTLVQSRPGDVEGPVVLVGLGRAGDFSPAVKGGIALIERGTITFKDKVASAASAGAKGAIIYNNQPGSFRGNIGEATAIPAVSISQEEGKRLADLIGQGIVNVRLSVQTTIEQVNSQNIIGTRRGASPRSIVVGAHFDSVPAGPGANDNASGTATMLEIARIMASTDHPLTLFFIAFGAEELGLLGSKHFVSSLTPQQLGQIVGMVNLDMVGVGDGLKVGGSKDLEERSMAIAGRMGLEVSSLGTASTGLSDHGSFIAAGVPAILIHYIDDPRYHTAQDTAQFVQPENLAATGKWALEIVKQLMGE